MAVKEKDYGRIAAKKITRPSASNRQPKLLIYSRNKKGKTLFGLSAPNCLTLDPEHGTDQFKKLDPPVWHIDRWVDVNDAYGFLRSGKHDYSWVHVDGLTRLHSLAMDYVRKVRESRDLTARPGLKTRKDYGNAGELIAQMMLNFNALDMGVVFTVQERSYTIGGEEDEAELTVQVPDLPQAARGMVNSLVDVIGRLYVVRVKLKGGREKDQRRLWVGPHAQLDTGYRSDHDLPQFVKNPTVEKVVNLLYTGKE